MRRRAETLAAWLPASLNLMLTAAIITLLLVNVTDSWLPAHFVDGLRRFDTGAGAAGSGAFCRFILTAMTLYVLSLSAFGLAITAALFAVARRVWQLAAR